MNQPFMVLGLVCLPSNGCRRCSCGDTAQVGPAAMPVSVRGFRHRVSWQSVLLSAKWADGCRPKERAAGLQAAASSALGLTGVLGFQISRGCLQWAVTICLQLTCQGLAVLCNGLHGTPPAAVPSLTAYLQDAEGKQREKAERLRFGRFFYRFPNGESG